MKLAFEQLLAWAASGCGDAAVDGELGRHAGDHPFDGLIQTGVIPCQHCFTELLALGCLGPVSVEGLGGIEQLMLTGGIVEQVGTLEANIASRVSVSIGGASQRWAWRARQWLRQM